ncbi:hypothetical protein ABN09_13715 [Morganella morganii]|nr:hypothetical protein ABN09_13715 [Morganella morganii]
MYVRDNQNGVFSAGTENSAPGRLIDGALTSTEGADVPGTENPTSGADIDGASISADGMADSAAEMILSFTDGVRLLSVFGRADGTFPLRSEETSGPGCP